MASTVASHHADCIGIPISSGLVLSVHCGAKKESAILQMADSFLLNEFLVFNA